MNTETKQNLLNALEENISPLNDVSHDALHAKRVAHLAEEIAKHEGGNIDIIYPAALFHDIVCYPKNSPQTNNSTLDSADTCRRILEKIGYPQNEIDEVTRIIANCSFSKGCRATSLEEKIVKDADMLEASGAIAVMRTFASAGCMQTPFYYSADPFRQRSEPENHHYGLDLFYLRLLRIPEHLYTDTAQKICQQRTEFLKIFLSELQSELSF